MRFPMGNCSNLVFTALACISLITVLLLMEMHTSDDVLDGWSPDDGDMYTCTTRIATHFNGSGSNILHFGFQVVLGDFSANRDVDAAGGAELILSALDGISLLVNRSN